MNMTDRESMDIERLLADAGVDFTVVDRCPDRDCELCAATGIPAAA